MRCMMLRSAADRDCRQAQGDASTLQSHCNTLTAGAHADPAVAAHHAKIEQEYQTLVADAPDTPDEWHNGAITRRGRRSNQKLKDTKQQATMAALQNSSKWEATICRMSQTCSTWSGHQSVSQPHGKGNVTSIFKGGSMDATQCNSYRPITVLPVIDKLFAAVLTGATEQNVHTARSPVSVQERAQHTRSAAGLHSSREAASGWPRTHTFFLDMQKAYDKVWHAGLFWKLHKNGITGKLWRIIHELYANSASTPIIEGQTTELSNRAGRCSGLPHVPTLFNVFIDDADDLQTQCHDDGIPISSALDRLVGMAYADDLKTVSGTHAGLQNIIIK
jgi:hypothetical protein